MKAQNKIINAHRRNIREERFLRRIELEKIELPLPTQSITLREYCKVPRALDAKELIVRDVQAVDIINHPFVPMEVPKNMKIPKLEKMKLAPWRAFMKEVEASLP